MKVMKKRFLFIVLLICSIPLLVLPQNKNNYAGLRIGPAFPFGEFSSTEANGAYAAGGYSVALEGGWFLNQKIGIGISVSEQVYPFRTAPYMANYLAGDPFTSHIEMKADPYETRNYLAGGLYRIPLSKKFSSQLKLMGGILWARTPSKFIGVETDAGMIYFWKTAAISRQLSALGGVSVQYKLFDHVELASDFNFSYAESGFTFERTDGTAYSIWYKMPSLQSTLGLNILF
jgi:hypothetical protein